MNRIASLALAVAVSLSPTISVAADLSVAEINQQIQQKQTEYDNYNTNLNAEISVAKEFENELESLRENGKVLEQNRQTALNEMNMQYERMIDDPSLDITLFRQTYVNAVRAHKENKDAISSKYTQWQDKLAQVDRIRVSKHSLLNKLESLKELLNNARVDRLYNEFNRQDTLTVDHTISCERDETITKCMERAKFLAKQKASKRFLDQLYDGLTESAEAKQHRSYSDTNVQIVRSDINSNSFSGLGDFSVNMNVDLKGNMRRGEACQLLSLDSRYCVPEKGSKMVAQVITPKPPEDMTVATDESVMYELTVRSNVFDDEVFIDGVSYGSTKLQVMLPAGAHDIEVVKRGYETYKATLELTEGATLKADLKRAQYSFSKGEKIQDILRGDIPGPKLVVVPAGNYRMGDITGLGLDNERPVQTKDINYSFGISETEVSVRDFQQFVDATSYVTSAEKGKGCAYYEGGEPLWKEQLNWRSPGFIQTEDHPAVCLSMQDAQAYVEWLSETSGNTYRLPSEVEWEYAARAGQETDYWWGEGVGTNNANCGWCGSEWSNNSSSPVGSFPQNSYGLFDTVGNVWEWSSSQSAENGVVVRGGAWNFAPRLARASTRMELAPDFRSNYIGFRVVREQ